MLRFFVGGLYRTGFISGDPHPGNFLLQDDGRVAFLDFGMTRHVPRGHVEDKIALFRAGLDGDAQRYHDFAVRIGFFPDAEVKPEQALAHFRAVSEWWREDREFTIDQPYIRRVMIDLGDPRSEHWGIMRKSTIPAEALLAGRTETLTLGVLGQLEATANWHRIMREYLLDGPPSTPLGEQDAEFWSGARARARRVSDVLEVSTRPSSTCARPTT